MPNVGEPTYASDVNAAGVIARGTRTTVQTCTGSEIGILRLDNVALLSGHAYLIQPSILRVDMTVTTDRPKFLIRYNLTGTATTSSSALARSERSGSEDLNSFPPPFGWIFPVADTTAASFLLTMVRASGTGNILCPPATASDEPITLSVIDYGVAPADTGVVI